MFIQPPNPSVRRVRVKRRPAENPAAPELLRGLAEAFFGLSPQQPPQGGGYGLPGLPWLSNDGGGGYDGGSYGGGPVPQPYAPPRGGWDSLPRLPDGQRDYSSYGSAFGPDGPPPGVLPGTGQYTGGDFKMTPWDIQNFVPRSPGGPVPNPGARLRPMPYTPPSGGYGYGSPEMVPGNPMRQMY